MKKKPLHNSICKKLAAQWLNEALCFVSIGTIPNRLSQPAFFCYKVVVRIGVSFENC